MVKMFKHQLIDLLQNSEQFDELLTHSVATAASSRRYELLQPTMNITLTKCKKFSKPAAGYSKMQM